MRVAVRVDASALIGGGHAMRCLTLANALTASGTDVTFVAAAMLPAIAERIEASGHRLMRIPASQELERHGADWHEPPLSVNAQTADAKAAADLVGSVDWVVVDHYLLDATWHLAARDFASHVLVIDDLASRSYNCDILVDETGGRTADDYYGSVSDSAIVLTGPYYALLRPEFARERPAALNRRSEVKTVKRILVSLGTTDPDAISEIVVSTVLAAAPECAVDVVLGKEAESLPRLCEMARRRSCLTVHIDSDSMAELMRDADLAIGAAGTTSWERCCLGLPTIAIMLAENQRPNAGALTHAGAAIMLESVGSIKTALTNLVGDSAHLQKMSAAAFALTDGQGTKRVSAAMLETQQASAVRA